MEEDGGVELLDEILAQAQREGALEGEGLAAFGDGLVERARLILGERAARHEGLARENAWRRETNTALERALAAERATGEAARDAHDRLLAHHRQVTRAVVEELGALAGLSPLRWRHARRRLRALAESLRQELP